MKDWEPEDLALVLLVSVIPILAIGLAVAMIVGTFS